MRDAAKFLTYCALTCFGGSERKQCPCECPADCEMRDHPDFVPHRRLATARLFRVAKAANDRDDG